MDGYKNKQFFHEKMPKKLSAFITLEWVAVFSSLATSCSVASVVTLVLVRLPENPLARLLPKRFLPSVDASGA